MARDDDEFREGMRALGVERLDEEDRPGTPVEGPRRARARRPPERKRASVGAGGDSAPKGWRRPRDTSAEDRDLFLKAFADLGTAPDKDVAGGDSDRSGGGPRRVRLPRRSTPRVDRRLDLHGATVEEARHRLPAFLASSAASGAKTVLVVTGRGRNSPGGRGVLRASVETWLRRHGGDRVERWAEAPRPLGGEGAFVLWLRRP